ncbi:MAG: DUF4442 domain-containing protein [Gammaproteobacteria bacterium]|nr:DUF4442 domain-containing protein [Gammaproteobacteria bacterium]
MQATNRLSRLFGYCFRLPAAWRLPAAGFLFGSAVKFFRTAGIRITALETGRVSMRIANRRKVQNHIKGVHATAMALLAESATGLVVGLNLPDDKLPLLKSMKIDYVKRAEGDLEAVAQLDAALLARVRGEERGEVLVPVRVTDSAGNEPIVAEFIWAWRPKK